MARFIIVWIIYCLFFNAHTLASPLLCSKLSAKYELFEVLKYHQSLAILRNLNNESVQFSNWLEEVKSHETKFDRDRFSHWKASLEKLAEAYLDSAGVAFTKTVKKVNLASLMGSALNLSDFLVELPLYQTTGRAGADAAMSSINESVHYFKSSPLKTIISPLLFIEKPDTFGYFDHRKDEVVLSTFGLFQDNLGISATVVHERQHGIEHFKLVRQELTLASFEARSSQASQKAYSEFLQLDELEAHFKEKKEFEIQVQDRSKYLPPELESKVSAIRSANLEEQNQALRDLIAKSRGIIASLQKVIDQKVAAKRIYFVGEIRYSEYAAPEGIPFDTLIFKTTAPNEEAFGSLFRKQLEWAKSRIDQIEQELNKERRN